MVKEALSFIRHKDRHDNVTEIHTGSDNTHMSDSNIFEIGDSTYQAYKLIAEAVVEIGRSMWTNPAILLLWKKRNDFHAIVIIGYVNEIAVPFLLDYKGTYINFCTPGIEPIQIEQQGNFLPTSVVPSMMIPFTQHMTFLQRTINPLSIFFKYMVHYFTMLPKAQKLLEEFFPEMPPPHTPLLEQLADSCQQSLRCGLPLLPTQVEVGTINAKRPRPLPQILKAENEIKDNKTQLLHARNQWRNSNIDEDLRTRIDQYLDILTDRQ
ncbi:UDP-glucosyltransferase 2-like [Procambarus clarkii]|uniref:UDP-glucosyltransferase 2-like n=1 Tax=Procambarus clarkii TaxID=6728 RepID=UPI003742408F